MDRRKIPRQSKSNILAWCSLDVQGSDTREIFKITNTTTSYDSTNLERFFQQFKDEGRDYGFVLLNTLLFEFHFTILPTVSGRGTTNREIESVLGNKSVIQIVNGDKIVFGTLCHVYYIPKMYKFKIIGTQKLEFK